MVGAEEVVEDDDILPPNGVGAFIEIGGYADDDDDDDNEDDVVLIAFLSSPEV